MQSEFLSTTHVYNMEVPNIVTLQVMKMVQTN